MRGRLRIFACRIAYLGNTVEPIYQNLPMGGTQALPGRQAQAARVSCGARPRLRAMRHLVLLASLLPVIASAAECVMRSGPTTAALVELYTSEGCSSCPPADRWLSQLAARPRDRVVPIAFHVTYWDHIGWRDPFASERHTARQRDRASAAGARYVYTPQVVVGGRDLREWSSARAFEARLQEIHRTAPRADLEIRQRIEGGRLHVDARARVAPGLASRDLALVVAATQDALASRVTAGENRGEHLRHDFVVREVVEARPLAPAVQAVFAIRPDWKPEALSVVAFVQHLGSGEVLQALAAPACR